MRFKPGITKNFIEVFVQVSKRAFRYYRNATDRHTRKPLVTFRKRKIEGTEPISINKASYVKPGSAIAKSGKEDKLFDNMFEITLRADYEDICF